MRDKKKYFHLNIYMYLRIFIAYNFLSSFTFLKLYKRCGNKIKLCVFMIHKTSAMKLSFGRQKAEPFNSENYFSNSKLNKIQIF